MKKYFFHLFTFSALTLFSSSLFALEGIVLVLEAPLLKEPKIDSTVLQTIRKGQRVYIPNDVVENGVLPEFIPTFDRAGNMAYIPGKYVKVVLNDNLEKKINIKYAGNDPTDYRIEEPIPDTYPFSDTKPTKLNASFLISPNTNSPFNYSDSYDSQINRNEMGLRVSRASAISYDQTGRSYFGFIALISTAKNTIEFNNDRNSVESRGVIRLGPWFNFDAFRNSNYIFSFGTGFTANFHRATIMVDSPLIGEERIFSGFSLSPILSTTFTYNNLIPNTDFIGGVDFSLYLPYSLKSDESVEHPELWNELSSIESELKANLTFFFGIQVKY